MGCNQIEKYANKRVGEIVTSKEGYEMTLIKYEHSTNCIIKFKDEFNTILSNVHYKYFKRGITQNPNKRTIFNIGYLGIGKYKSRYTKGAKTEAYSTWFKMIMRCYCIKIQQQQPAYVGVTVCEEWHNFQNFAKFYEENYIEGWHLDKDILVEGNKVYGPNVCCFVPVELNSFFSKRGNQDRILPIGVSMKGNSFISSGGMNGKSNHHGSFKTAEEAFEMYKEKKEDYAKILAERWKNKVKSEVYERLLNWRVKRYK